MAESFETRTGRIQRKNPLTSILSDVGKILPQAVDLEEAVLGALMMESGAIDQIDKLLTSGDMFYRDEHREIYNAILKMNRQNIPIDLLSLTNFMRTLGNLEFAGGAFYLSELTNRVSSAAHIMYHSMIILQKYMLREVIRVSNDAMRDAYDETTDVFEAVDTLIKESEKIRDIKMDKPEERLGMVVQQISEELKVVKEETKKEENGVPTLFKDFDTKIGLLLFGSLITIAARPGNGKTALTTQILYQIAKNLKIPTAIFSYEMTNVQLAARIISKELDISSGDILRGNILPSKISEIDKHIVGFNDIPFYLDDNSEDDVLRLCKKIRAMVKKYGLKAVGVDYIQIIPQVVSDRKNQMSNRDLEIGVITRALKKLAKELGIIIIALSQLNRKAEERRKDEKSPIISDIREGGTIENDSDVILFIFRPELYDIKEEYINGVKVSTENLAKIIIAKNRFGAHSIFIPLKWTGKTTSFSDWDNNGPDLYNNFSQPDDDSLPF